MKYLNGLYWPYKYKYDCGCWFLQMFPSLNKVVFLDDDLVVQTDLSPLWDIDMNGKVNGAVETCMGEDKFVMSKRLKSYLNFSHPLISNNFDANECAWAYGMNIFDLEAWRNTNISNNYHYWLEEVTHIQTKKETSFHWFVYCNVLISFLRIKVLYFEKSTRL